MLIKTGQETKRLNRLLKRFLYEAFINEWSKLGILEEIVNPNFHIIFRISYERLRWLLLMVFLKMMFY